MLLHRGQPGLRGERSLMWLIHKSIQRDQPDMALLSEYKAVFAELVFSLQESSLTDKALDVRTAKLGNNPRNLITCRSLKEDPKP